MNLVEVLSEQARVRPAVDALRQSTGHVTFSELEERTARGAALLRRLRLTPGDPVLVFVPMSIDLYVVLLSILRAGLVATFLDPSAGQAHIERCCAQLPPRAFIAIARAQLLRATSPALRRIPLALSVGFPLFARRWSAHQAMDADPAITARSADDPALVTFTSGSTGEPKAAVRSHGFLIAQHRVLQRSLGHVAGSLDLATLPIFALANLASGVTTLIPNADLRAPGAIDPLPVMEQIDQQRPRTAVASPAFFERLADGCASSGRSLSGFASVFTGGAPVFPRTLDRLQEAFPGAAIVAVYGSTEAEPIAEIARADMTAADLEAMRAGRGLLTGAPIPEISLRVIRDQWGAALGPFADAQFADQAMPVGEPGEIVVSGAHVLTGYLGGRGDRETKFTVDGTVWHRTGDAGYLDADGRLWLLGRCAARIVDGRGTLHPFAVETAAQQCAGIARAALIAIDGKRVLAYQREPGAPDPAPALSAALAWAALDRLVPLAIPLDKRHNAKVDYPELRRRLAV